MGKHLSYSLLVIFSLFYFVFPKLAFAHFPKTDGDITVTLHIDPDDNPTPGKQANLYFLFDDSSSRFYLPKCICILFVYEKNKQIYKHQLTDNKNSKFTIWGTATPFVFPTNDVYEILLTGKPYSGNVFQQFKLSWYFRVDSGGSGIIPEHTSDIPIIFGVVFFGFVFLVLLGFLIKREIIDMEK